MDIQGREVLKIAINGTGAKVDLSSYENGIYILTIKNSNSIFMVKKVILTK